MDQVARPAEPHHVTAQRILRPRRHLVRQDVAFLFMLLAHRQRRRPHRVLHVRYDLGAALRRRPADLADADRMGEHLHRAVFRRVLGRLRVIVEPHRGEVQHQPFARRVRQHELRRQHDRRALARQPGIDAGIGAHEFLVADVEAPRDVGERVLFVRVRDLQPADHALVGGHEEAVGGLRERQRRRHGLGRFLLPARPRLLAPERFERRAGRHRGQHGGNEQ